MAEATTAPAAAAASTHHVASTVPSACKHSAASIPTATAAATATSSCSCGVIHACRVPSLPRDQDATARSKSTAHAAASRHVAAVR